MSGSRISVGASAIRPIRCSWSSCPHPRSRRPRKPKPPRRSLAADFRSRAGARRPRRKRRRLKRTPRPRPRRPRPRRKRRRRREQRPKTPHWKARVAYDGTDYAGFQVQPNAQTVQGELERALSTVCDGAVRVTGAGRTDAGVHASGQVIDFRTASTLDGLSIGRGVNALLPEEITADAFLRGMVRAIVGTLLWVGRGKIDVRTFEGIVAANDRAMAGPSASANGLCLIAVEYGQDAANAASEEGLQGIPPLREEDE